MSWKNNDVMKLPAGDKLQGDKNMTTPKKKVIIKLQVLPDHLTP